MMSRTVGLPTFQSKSPMSVDITLLLTQVIRMFPTSKAAIVSWELHYRLAFPASLAAEAKDANPRCRGLTAAVSTRELDRLWGAWAVLTAVQACA